MGERNREKKQKRKGRGNGKKFNGGKEEGVYREILEREKMNLLNLKGLRALLLVNPSLLVAG